MKNSTRELLILKYLLDQTDENHFITIADINEYLAEHTKTAFDEIISTREHESNLMFEINRLRGKGLPLLRNGGFTREIAKAFINRVYIYSGDEIEVQFKFDDIYQQLLECCAKDVGN